MDAQLATWQFLSIALSAMLSFLRDAHGTSVQFAPYVDRSYNLLGCHLQYQLEFKEVHLRVSENLERHNIESYDIS